MAKRPPFSRRGEQAIQAFQEAGQADAMTRREPGDDVVYTAEARIAREKGEVLLQLASAVTVSAGEAITWENKADEIFRGAHARIIDTLENPNSISAGASNQRMSAALA